MVQIFEIVNCAAYNSSAKLEVGLERERDQFGLYICQRTNLDIRALYDFKKKSMVHIK